MDWGQSVQSLPHDSLYTRYGNLLLGSVEKTTTDKIFFKTAYGSSAVDIKLAEIAKLRSSTGFLLNDIRNKNWRGQLVLDSASKGLVGIRTLDSVYYFPKKRSLKWRRTSGESLRTGSSWG